MSNSITVLTPLAVTGVSAATTSLTIAQQLNVLYPFLYLMLPLWVFFSAVVIVSLLGATGALLTDVVDDEISKPKKLALAFGTGLISSFIILPAFVSAPSMSALLITSLGASFAGSVLIFILAQVLKDKELKTAIKNSLSKSLLYGFSKIENFIDYFIKTKDIEK